MNTSAPYRSACAYIRSSASGLRLRGALLEQSRFINTFYSGSQHILTCTVVEGSAGNQPELERLLASATSPERPFDEIVVTSLCRLSRAPAALQHIEARLAAADVRLIVLKPAPKVAATPMSAEIL